MALDHKLSSGWPFAPFPATVPTVPDTKCGEWYTTTPSLVTLTYTQTCARITAIAPSTACLTPLQNGPTVKVHSLFWAAVVKGWLLQ